MGHNMGMLHDFDAQHGGSGGACDGTGIMSYGSAPNQWSTCSKNDFLALYNQIIASSSWNWCLEGKYVVACLLFGILEYLFIFFNVNMF